MRFGVHVVSVQRRRVSQEQSLFFGDDSEAVNRFSIGCNELIIVGSVFPTKPGEEKVWSLARLASGWGWEGRRRVRVGEITLEEGFDDVREEGSTLVR
jgi:hypothetical protein